VETPDYINVTVGVNETITNTTDVTIPHDDIKEANVAACVILSLLLVACIVIGIVMLIKMMNEKE